MANIRDFYMRSENDPQFIEDQIEVYDDLEATVSNVRMTLLTNKGEVLGEPGFGLDIEKYLFDFEIDPFVLSDDAQYQINTYIPESTKRSITVSPTYTTDERDRKIYALQISIDSRKNVFAVLYE